MKYSAIMPYYDRAKQLHQTLLSFMQLYWNRSDFEVVIVRDSKMTNAMDNELRDAISEFPESVVRVIDSISKTPCYNPASAFNNGVSGFPSPAKCHIL